MNLRSGKSSAKKEDTETKSAPTDRWRTVHRSLLPKFLQDNEFLIHGHRPQLPSFTKCFNSIFRIHTETGNIWSHLLGSLGFLLTFMTFVWQPPDRVTTAEKLSFSVFFVGAVVCMGMSTVFHTVCCHSEETQKLFSKLDYVGILILIVSSFSPWLYFGFYCDDQNLGLYYIMAEVSIGLLCTIAVVDNRFSTPKLRPIRAVLFIGLGLTGVVPGIHFLALHGFLEGIRFLGWLLLMAASYIFGAVIYACRVPERLAPGKFDIWGQSHQVLHICVIIGALLCYYGAADLAHYRLSAAEPCPTIG